MTPEDIKRKLDTEARLAAATAAESAYKRTIHSQLARVTHRKRRNPTAYFKVASAGKDTATKAAMWDETKALLAAVRIDAITSAVIENAQRHFDDVATAISGSIIGKAPDKPMVAAFETARETKRQCLVGQNATRLAKKRRNAVYVYEKARLARQKALQNLADHALGGKVDIEAMKMRLSGDSMPGAGSVRLN